MRSNLRLQEHQRRVQGVPRFAMSPLLARRCHEVARPAVQPCPQVCSCPATCTAAPSLPFAGEQARSPLCCATQHSTWHSSERVILTRRLNRRESAEPVQGMSAEKMQNARRASQARATTASTAQPDFQEATGQRRATFHRIVSCKPMRLQLAHAECTQADISLCVSRSRCLLRTNAVTHCLWRVTGA